MSLTWENVAENLARAQESHKELVKMKLCEERALLCEERFGGFKTVNEKEQASEPRI